MSSPVVKRRRFNDAANTLAKPFVSPLRSANADRKPLRENSNVANVPYTPSTLAHTIKASNASDIVASPPSRPAAPQIKSTYVRKGPTFTSTSKRKDPAEIAAQRALTTLELQIRALRNDLDTLTQADAINNSTQDTELEALTEKWRLASHQAAEELFGTVRDRVNRMGGVAAWRESEKKKYERSHGLGEFAETGEKEEDDDADCEFDSQGEELPEEEVEFRKSEKRRVRREAEEAADLPSDAERQGDEAGDAKSKVWSDEGKDDDAFTMDMMLRSLNIDLDVIGYDKHGQRWT